MKDQNLFLNINILFIIFNFFIEFHVLLIYNDKLDINQIFIIFS